MDYYQWLIEWVWVPLGVAMLEAFRRLLNLRSEIRRLRDEEAQRNRRAEITDTAARNLESRVAHLEGYLDRD